MLDEWLAQREHTVSAKTYTADAALARLMPKFLSSVQIGSVTDREVSGALVALNRSGLAESSVRRFRASVSAFFAWAVLERIVATNPVKTAPMPKARALRSEMRPFSEADLEAFCVAAAEHDPRLADVLLVAGWTGLRWSELREVRARDLVGWGTRRSRRRTSTCTTSGPPLTRPGRTV